MRVGHLTVCSRMVVLVGMGLGMFLLPALLAAQSKAGQGKKDSKNGVGFVLSKDVTEQDLGLPIYPGARRYRDAPDEGSAVKMGLQGGNSGFKVVVLKLLSDDSPEKIAAFYRKALAQYGQVLECTTSSAKSEKSGDSGSKNLTCDDDDIPAGGFTLKAGSREKQHVVGIKPKGRRSNFALIYVEAPGLDSDKD